MESNNLKNNDIRWNYYKARDDANCDFYKHLKIIVESKDSYWNYRTALLCLSEKRIPPTERIKYVIMHAEILFENNDLEYIIRFINKIYNKDAYQEYIKSKESIKYYEERLEQQKKKNKLAEQEREKEMTESNSNIIIEHTDIMNLAKSPEEISEYILTLEEPEYNYYAIANLEITKNQKQRHFKKILESGDAYWNYKCIKIILRSKSLNQDEKALLIKEHIEIVFNSEDKKIINELLKFLKYKPTYNRIVNSKTKSRKKSYN